MNGILIWKRIERRSDRLRHGPDTDHDLFRLPATRRDLRARRVTVDGELSDMRNPSYGVRRFKLKTRERFLTPEEQRHLEEVLLRGLQLPPGRKGHLEPMGVWALQLLSLTGLRRDEIRDLTWPMVDWQHSCLNLPDMKTGQRNIPVPSQVMALLRQIHDRTGNRKEGLVVHSRTGRKLTGLNLTWKNIREAVGIPDVRLHDLRHSFASDALCGGVLLAIVGEMLGHPSCSTRCARSCSRAASPTRTWRPSCARSGITETRVGPAAVDRFQGVAPAGGCVGTMIGEMLVCAPAAGPQQP